MAVAVPVAVWLLLQHLLLLFLRLLHVLVFHALPKSCCNLQANPRLALFRGLNEPGTYIHDFESFSTFGNMGGSQKERMQTFFAPTGQGRATCTVLVSDSPKGFGTHYKLCGKEIALGDGGSNMARHMETHHPEHMYLLLAATLLDPTQANSYFSPQGASQANAVAAKALLDRAWTAISTIGSTLSNKARPPTAASDSDEHDAGAGAIVPAPAFAGLIGLLGINGAAVGVPAAGAYTLADEQPSFFKFLQDEFVKRADDQLSACAWYRKHMERIPKIAAM